MVSLERYVENGTYDSNVENHDFLTKYGIHNGDPVNNVLSLVKRVLNENRPKFTT
jgi:hypothetical protein